MKKRVFGIFLVFLARVMDAQIWVKPHTKSNRIPGPSCPVLEASLNSYYRESLLHMLMLMLAIWPHSPAVQVLLQTLLTWFMLAVHDFMYSFIFRQADQTQFASFCTESRNEPSGELAVRPKPLGPAFTLTLISPVERNTSITDLRRERSHSFNRRWSFLQAPFFKKLCHV